MKTVANDTAYPALEQCGNPEFWNTYIGLTKREYFAAIALQGLLANPNPAPIFKSAAMAVEAADDLINLLNK